MTLPSRERRRPQGLLPTLLLSLSLAACEKAGEFPDQEALCRADTAREALRADSATEFPAPVLMALRVNGELRWQAGQPGTPSLAAGDIVTLEGQGFGAGPDIDFSKLMIGNVRVLETDLVMYEQRLDLLRQVNFEIPAVQSRWEKNILTWNDSEIRFRVPRHASGGPLIVQVQKREGQNVSALRPGEPHLVIDAQTARITDKSFSHGCDVVSRVSASKATTPITVSVTSPAREALVAKGEAIFWGYDFNIGLAHKIRKLDWKAIFEYRTRDPLTGQIADPEHLFGAYRTVEGEVPSVALNDYYFDRYPQKNPIPGFLTLTPQATRGNTRNTGWVGYRYAQSVNPYTGPGSWIGFNCASCHGYRIRYEQAPGQEVTQVFPGLPNPLWSMRWTLLGNFKGILAEENGPAWTDGSRQPVDKTQLIYHMPQGTGEHNVVRLVGEGSETDNDYQFSPITIPGVTHYLPIRRSLSHTESYVGFEGSYIHSQEPDGALGAMNRDALEALTAYMATLDQQDDTLRNVGLYRWLRQTGQLAAQTGRDTGEGQFVQQGWQSYPGVVSQVDAGKAIFKRDCGGCHSDQVGAHTNEAMIPLTEVGRFFAPTIYQKQVQSIRVSFLRNLYWLQHRGLLSDGHVRNLEELVDPERCTPGSALHDRYYTLHPPVDLPSAGVDHPVAYPAETARGDVFRIRKADNATSAGQARNRFIERHRYFVEVPWDADHYYWDYQKMRSDYGAEEMGTAAPLTLPATPHGWCADSPSDIAPLVQYLLTL
jgi:hypothetical protein